MKFVILSRDPVIVTEAGKAFQPDDQVVICSEWPAALEACSQADMIFVDLIATLATPGLIAGYEEFAEAKMAHSVASKTPLVLIAPPEDYELDSMVGYPDFVMFQVRRPVTFKILRRMSTYV
jgi:hypothetical protein